MRQKAIDAVDLLNDFIGDLIIGVNVLREYGNQKKLQSAYNTYFFYSPAGRHSHQGGNCMKQERTARIFAIAFIIGTVLCTTGCSHHVSNDITSRMIPDEIYNDYKVQPQNLLTESKCNTPPTIKIINIESRIEDYKFGRMGVHSYFVKPREISESAASYLKAGYEKSGINSDDNSTKRIEIKLSDIEWLPGMWQHGSKVRIDVNIPGAKISKIYEASENGQVIYTLIADSIHLITRQIIDDQAIQQYILCR